MKFFNQNKSTSSALPENADELLITYSNMNNGQDAVLKLLNQDTSQAISLDSINAVFEKYIAQGDLKTAHAVLQLRPDCDEDLQAELKIQTQQSIINLTENQNFADIQKIIDYSSKSPEFENIKGFAALSVDDYGKQILRGNNPEEIENFLAQKPFLGSTVEKFVLRETKYSLASDYLNYALNHLHDQPHLLPKIVQHIVDENEGNQQTMQDLTKILVEHGNNSKSVTNIRRISDAISIIPDNQEKSQFFLTKLSPNERNQFDLLSSVVEKTVIRVQDEVQTNERSKNALSKDNIDLLHQSAKTFISEKSSIPEALQTKIRETLRKETEQYIEEQINKNNIVEAARVAKSAEDAIGTLYSSTDKEMAGRSRMKDFLAAKQEAFGLKLLSEGNTEQIAEFIKQKPILFHEFSPDIDRTMTGGIKPFEKSLAAKTLEYARDKPELLGSVLTLLKEQHPIDIKTTKKETFADRVKRLAGYSSNNQAIQNDQVTQDNNDNNINLFYAAFRDQLIKYSNEEQNPEKRAAINKQIETHLKDYLDDDSIQEAANSNNTELIKMVVAANQDDNYARIPYNQKAIQLLLDANHNEHAKVFLHSQGNFDQAVQDLNKSEHIRFVYDQAASAKITPQINDVETIKKVVKVALTHPQKPKILKSLAESISQNTDLEKKKELFNAFVEKLSTHEKSAELLYNAIDGMPAGSLPLNEQAIHILRNSGNEKYATKAQELTASNTQIFEDAYNKFTSATKFTHLIVGNKTSLENSAAQLAAMTNNPSQFAQPINELIKTVPIIDDQIVEAFKENPKLFAVLDQQNINRLTNYLRDSLAISPENEQNDWRNQFLFHVIDKNSHECKTGDDLRKKVNNLVFQQEDVIRKEQPDQFQAYLDKKEYNEKLEAATGIISKIKQFLRKRRAQAQGKDIEQYKQDKLMTRLKAASANIISEAVTTLPTNRTSISSERTSSLSKA